MEIKQIGSPFFGSRNGIKPCAIVNHVSVGTLGSMTAWFNDKSRSPGSSSHFGVGLDGTILQYCRIEDRAFTQGIHLPAGILDATAPIVKDKSIDPNRFCVSIEREGYHTIQDDGTEVGKIGWLDGSDIPEPQWKSILWLHRYIKDYIENKLGGHLPLGEYTVLGHFMIDPKRKPFCPGIHFPWEDLYKEMRIANGRSLEMYEMNLALRGERKVRLAHMSRGVNRFIDLWKKANDPLFEWTEQALDTGETVTQWMEDNKHMNE